MTEEGEDEPPLCSGFTSAPEITDGARMEGDIRRCFQKLLVLDVRYTQCNQILSAQTMDFMTQLRELNVIGAQDWDIGQLQGRLPSIRKLRVQQSTVSCSCSQNNLFSEMNNLELLDFSGSSSSEMNKMKLIDFSRRYTDSPMTNLSGPRASNNSSCLHTIIIAKGCGFEQISFRGCTKLKNILLEGPMRFQTLDISGTAVKILDLTATRIGYLDELYLLGCENLCAITWPPKDKFYQRDLSKMCIDTTQSAPAVQYREENAMMDTTATIGKSETAALHGSRLVNEFPWYISVRDARLLGSLESVYSNSRKIYVEVSSPTSPTIAAGGCKGEGIWRGGRSDRHTAPAIYTEDSIVDCQQQATESDGDAPGIMWVWPCPNVPDLQEKSCYMHIQDQMSSPGGNKEASGTITVPEFVLDCAKILHVHDSLSITSIPLTTTRLGSEWRNLEWCRIERCPSLDSIFTSLANNSGRMFEYQLRTFWASRLPKARYIWKLSEISSYSRTFDDLTFLHLDSCPRLIHVLPFCATMIIGNSLSQLMTLEITWCGDIREVFPLDAQIKHFIEQRQPATITTLDFPRLKYIHLHELPRLQRICAVKISAPNLETVKIRGCWSLKRLPDVSGSNKEVECDCEKEWWDRLEWEDSSQASLYKPIHSRYYKKTLLKGTVLR